jgi:hypothetical protein
MTDQRTSKETSRFYLAADALASDFSHQTIRKIKATGIRSIALSEAIEAAELILDDFLTADEVAVALTKLPGPPGVLGCALMDALTTRRRHQKLADTKGAGR